MPVRVKREKSKTEMQKDPHWADVACGVCKIIFGHQTHNLGGVNATLLCCNATAGRFSHKLMLEWQRDTYTLKVPRHVQIG